MVRLKQDTKNGVMKPQIKATITLPFAIAVIAGAVIVLTSHPAIFIWGLTGISSVAIIGSLWYSLYCIFGGKV
jgi:hypothetical protein